MRRRTFIEIGALATSGLFLPGCTTLVAKAGGRKCIPAVDVSEDRLLRSVVGLRPYRASGFVVRTEQVGDRQVIHNYGHGGAGITLSWGTAHLAADLAMRESHGTVAVLGAGVAGLTTARLLQERGVPVNLYAKALPPATTSNVAGGQWGPFGHFDESSVSPEWRAQYAAALAYSWQKFQTLVGKGYGVRWLPTYTENVFAPDSPLNAYRVGLRQLRPDEHAFSNPRISIFHTMYVETDRFLDRLLGAVRRAGALVQVREFHEPADLGRLEERTVVNCTGLGSRQLFGDEDLVPVRGQLAILRPQREIAYAFTGRGGYMFPHADGIMLGGTSEPGIWDLVPSKADQEMILESHRAVFENMHCPARA